MRHSASRGLPTRLGIFAILLGLSASGCNTITNLIDAVAALNAPPASPSITFVSPSANSSIASGATAVIQWADVAFDAGTAINLTASRISSSNTVIETLTLFDARDAIADGDSDMFVFDTAGRTLGSYRFTLTLTAPGGFSQTVVNQFLVTVR